MAIGADGGLPKSQPSVFRQPSRAASPQQSAPSYGYRPPMIADSRVQDAVNNQMEAGAGAKQMARMSLDNTTGVSRGRGIDFASDMAQSEADAKSRAGAAATEMSAASANANAQSQYENTMNSERLANAGLLEGLRNSSAMERMQGRGFQQSLMEAMRRGQFGLDQQQLDYTPLLNQLFS